MAERIPSEIFEKKNRRSFSSNALRKFPKEFFGEHFERIREKVPMTNGISMHFGRKIFWEITKEIVKVNLSIKNQNRQDFQNHTGIKSLNKYVELFLEQNFLKK